MYEPRTELVINRTKWLHQGMAHDEYDAFVHTIEQGSISAAARILDLPRPTVSRRLQRLEERLGERLVSRGSRRISPTSTGQRLYESIRAPLAQLAAAEQELRDRGEAPRGLVRVAVPPLLAPSLGPLMADFRYACPDVALDVRTEVRHVDLAREGFDVAIRGGTLRDPELVQRRLIDLEVSAWASDAYIQAHGEPRHPDELASHALLRGMDADGQPRRFWPLHGGGGVPVDGAFVTDDRALLRSATAAGLGISLLGGIPTPPVNVRRVVVPQIGTVIGLHVVYPSRRLLPPRTRAFVDAVVAWFAEPRSFAG